MSSRHPKLLLEDILESAEKIITYTQSLPYNEFIADDKTVDAVIRNFGIIGEAANRLPVEIKENNEKIEWNKITGLRNRMIHEYFGINYDIIWSIIEDYLPGLVIQIKELIKSY